LAEFGQNALMGFFETKNIAGLQTNVIQGKPGGRAIIVFHGYGADFNDLMPIADMMNLNDVTWYFPNGTQQVIVGPGFTGRAWFPIDMDRIEAAMVQGKHYDLTKHRPSGIDRARDLAMKLYDEVAKSHREVYLGGFSQGAMLATEVAMNANRKPEGLVLMSGVLIDEANWAKWATKLSGLRFIQ
jgi:phospholipase/carboxylesterase